MRLTLRTLLAYRDRVLNAVELDDMHRRVQQSSMAGNLLKRIDTLVQRTQILAPPVDGKGLGADANSIAEYLDDTLKGDKVPELERICLESDVQLAELAQCHNLLSTALLKTVDVPQPLRDRIHRLGDPTERARALAERTPVVDPTPMRKEKSLAESPKPASRAWRNPSGQSTASSTATSNTIRADVPHRPTTNGQSANGSKESDRESVQPSPRVQIKALPVEAPMLASGGDSIKPAGLDLEGAQLAHEVPEYLRGRTHDGWRAPLAILTLIALLAFLSWQSIGSIETVRELFASRASVPIPNKVPKDDGVKQDSNSSSEIGPESNTSAVPVDVPKANEVPVGNGPSSPDSNAKAPSELANQPATSEDGASSNEPSVPKNPTPEANASVESGVAARWMPADENASHSILLTRRGVGEIQRLMAASKIQNGTQVIVPVAGRPVLELSSGPRWQVCGSSMFMVQGGTAKTPARVDFFLGRALISSSIQQTLDLATTAGACRIELAEPETQIAIELTYTPILHGPITDRAFALPFLAMTVVSGRASVQLAGATTPPNSVTAGKSLLIGGGTMGPMELPPIPEWILEENDRPIDHQAKEDLHRELQNKEEVLSTLLRLAAGRRPETAAMASTLLAMLGNWDWLSSDKNVMTDARARSHWPSFVDQLRQVLAVQPDQVVPVVRAMSATDESKAELRRNLLLGFTEAQLEKDALATLVATLESESMLERILAIHQLTMLTGKDFGYQANEVNRTSVQQWKKELSSGRLKVTPSTAKQ